MLTVHLARFSYTWTCRCLEPCAACRLPASLHLRLACLYLTTRTLLLYSLARRRKDPSFLHQAQLSLTASPPFPSASILSNLLRYPSFHTRTLSRLCFYPPPALAATMCYQVVERYSVCKCLYYKHAVDQCRAAGQHGHRVQEKTVLVGYACSVHSSHRPEAVGGSGVLPDSGYGSGAYTTQR